MICSFKHNFVFIKTRKTAGTSVEIALSKYCGSRDIITPVTAEDEITRSRMGRCAQNYSSVKSLEHIYRAATLANSPWLLNAVRFRGYWIFNNHMPASRIADRVPPTIWDSAFKFTVERHPYERAVSFAFHKLAARRREPTMKNLVRQIDLLIDKEKLRNFPIYTIGNQLAVDFIIRHENLVEDLNKVARRIDLPPISGLPRAKSQFRRDKRPASEILSPGQKRMIRENCAFEFELMGYDA